MAKPTLFQVQDKDGNVLAEKSFSNYTDFENWAASYNPWKNGVVLVCETNPEFKKDKG